MRVSRESARAVQERRSSIPETGDAAVSLGVLTVFECEVRITLKLTRVDRGQAYTCCNQVTA